MECVSQVKEVGVTFNTKLLGEMSLESLRDMYHTYNTDKLCDRRKQDVITRHLFKRFEGYIYKHVGSKTHFINSYDFDDWKSIVQTAVWEGFIKKEGNKEAGDKEVLYNILNSVQYVLANTIQHLSAVKRGYFQETAVDFLEDVAVHETKYYADEWINNIEIKRLLDEMPEKKRIAIEYFLEGYPVLSNKWNEPQVGPCIKKFTGMQDCTLYNWINEFVDKAQKEMTVPKELLGQHSAGVNYHIEKEVGKKRKYPVIVNPETGEEMFTMSYYANMKKRKARKKNIN